MAATAISVWMYVWITVNPNTLFISHPTSSFFWFSDWNIIMFQSPPAHCIAPSAVPVHATTVWLRTQKISVAHLFSRYANDELKFSVLLSSTKLPKTVLVWTYPNTASSPSTDCPCHTHCKKKKKEKKKIWLLMGLMITNDGVDDDSDAVSGGDDYNNIGGCHCSDPLNHSSLVSCCTFS